jgi:predicted neuraminidase
MKPFFLSALILLLSLTASLTAQVNKTGPAGCEVMLSGMVLDNPPFAQCHASTIAQLADGSMLAAFFAGTHESAPDVKIWASTYKENRWTDPVILADGRMHDTVSYPCWNPVLFKSSAGRLYLFYKVGKNPREWFGMMKYSDDDGLNWSNPSILPVGILGPIKNKPEELPDGRLLCPSSTETKTQWKVQMEIYDPKTNHWQLTKVDQGNPFQVIQPTILRQSDSTYRILCRSKNNSVVTSLSGDNGKTWGNLSVIELPNPNSGIDGVTMRDGGHLLVYNPLKRGSEWSNGRNRLNLAWSPDGINWSDILVLENEESGEFSYPAIIQSSDNMIHITYTHNRTQIRYWKIRLRQS